MTCAFSHKPGACSGRLDPHHILSQSLLKRTFPHGAVRERPRLLDLFCGAGGAAMGYSRAGFDVVGVDIEPQPNYPFEFHQGDVFEWLTEIAFGTNYDGFVAIHASPLCQFATAYKRVGNVKDSPNLIPLTRRLLRDTALPYVIENVEGARSELVTPVMLCGSSFGLDVRRHRLFECSFPAMSLGGCVHGTWGPDRFPGGRSKERTGSSRGLVRATVEVGSWDIPLDVQQQAMGIDWMTVEELSQAIPPAYTEHLGSYLIDQLPKTHRPLDRRESTEPDVPLRAILDNPHNIVSVCRFHHAQLTNARFTLSRSELPEGVEAFASDYGLSAQLDRLYGPEVEAA